nr:Fic family protein [Limosilactobacillus fermentum]
MEAPTLPGHLRNYMYNEEDNVHMIAERSYSPNRRLHTPPKIVTEGMLKKMIDRFDTSEYTTKDGWRVFADLAKMQPFQDGNKRTALIAANEAMGAFETQDFLVLPLQPESNTKFIGLLMRYYLTDDATQQDRLLDEMVSLTPGTVEQEQVWQAERDRLESIKKLSTRRVKPFWGGNQEFRQRYLKNLPDDQDL